MRRGFTLIEPSHAVAQSPRRRGSTSAFTLIELSIVLVIIGLIIGGVLAGQHLIKAAEIRGTVSQRNQFDLAVTTFKLKYNCLPGDCSNAIELGVGYPGIDLPSNYGGNGDGNGIIGGNSDPVAGSGNTEPMSFWYHLSQAKLINFTPTLNNGFTSTCTNENNIPITPCLALSTTSQDSTYIGGWFIFNPNDQNISSNPMALGGGHYWRLTGKVTGAFDPEFDHSAAILLPIDAYAIDSKIDDGLPLSGGVLAAGDKSSNLYGPDSPSIGVGGASSDTCVDNSSTPNTYNSANTNRTRTNLCSMVIKTSF